MIWNDIYVTKMITEEETKLTASITNKWAKFKISEVSIATALIGIYSNHILFLNYRYQGRRHGRDWVNSPPPPLLIKAIFENRLGPLRKNWGHGGGGGVGDVTNHTWISACVCHKWFSKTGRKNLNLRNYFIHFIDVLNLCFLFWNSCEMPIVLCVAS